MAFDYESRLQLIKKVHKARQERERRDKEMLAEIEASEVIKTDDTNINHWTDASQYANQYYGEVYKQTTQYDNDWN
jgi:hypothetical protein